MSFEKADLEKVADFFVNINRPDHLEDSSFPYKKDCHDNDHKYITKILLETVLQVQQRMEIQIGENLRLNGIIEKMNNRLEKLERANIELKINSFHQSLDEYDEVIGRLHGLLKKYEEENETLKAIKGIRMDQLKEEIQCKQDELAILETEIEGQKR